MPNVIRNLLLLIISLGALALAFVVGSVLFLLLLLFIPIILWQQRKRMQEFQENLQRYQQSSDERLSDGRVIEGEYETIEPGEPEK